MTTVNGIRIDASPIAQGLKAMMEKMPDGKSYLNALQLGMLPGPLMAILEKMLGEKFDQIAWASLGVTREIEKVGAMEHMKSMGINVETEKDVIDQVKRKEFVRAAVKVISQELYKIGDLVV